MKFLLIDIGLDISSEIYEYFKYKQIDVRVVKDYEYIFSKRIDLFGYDALILTITENNHAALDLLEYMQLTNIKKPVIGIGTDKSIELLGKLFGKGAEDYMLMPIRIKELELRMMRSVRRIMSADDNHLINDIIYSYTDKTIFDGKHFIDLTRKQHQLLYLLVTHKNQLVTYDMIYDYLYDGQSQTNNTIATHIRNIRRKITDIPIKASKGEGYVLKLIQ